MAKKNNDANKQVALQNEIAKVKSEAAAAIQQAHSSNKVAQAESDLKKAVVQAALEKSKL